MKPKIRILKGVSVVFFLVLSFFFFQIGRSFADDPTPTPSPTLSPTPGVSSNQLDDLRNKIRDLQGKISGLHDQEKSLSSAISVMDNQVKLTEYKMEDTKQQILSLTSDISVTEKRISNLDGSLNDITKALISRVKQTYQVGSIDPMQILLTSNNLTNFITRLNYLRIMQAHDKRLIYDTQQAKNDYANQKQIFEAKKAQVEALKKQLEDYATQINQEKDAKTKLLSETQGSESNYQRLLSQAQAQLAGFSSFAQSQGGASLLGNQTVCDDWGCYYNQRDSQWGGVALNNTQYTIASDGCLMTDVAMVMTHYGRKTTPLDINSNPNNFASYYPAYLLYKVTANGATSERIGATIDATLSSGNPVIVGIRYSSGGTHFVVLKSGSGGNYVMDDPFTPNGHNMNFTDKYSLNSIFEIDKVVML